MEYDHTTGARAGDTAHEAVPKAEVAPVVDAYGTLVGYGADSQPELVIEGAAAPSAATLEASESDSAEGDRAVIDNDEVPGSALLPVTAQRPQPRRSALVGDIALQGDRSEQRDLKEAVDDPGSSATEQNDEATENGASDRAADRPQATQRVNTVIADSGTAGHAAALRPEQATGQLPGIHNNDERGERPKESPGEEDDSAEVPAAGQGGANLPPDKGASPTDPGDDDSRPSDKEGGKEVVPIPAADKNLGQTSEIIPSTSPAPPEWSGSQASPPPVEQSAGERNLDIATPSLEGNDAIRELQRGYEAAKTRLGIVGDIDPSTITSTYELTTLFSTVAEDVRTIVKANGFRDPAVRHDWGGYPTEVTADTWVSHELDILAMPDDLGEVTFMMPGPGGSVNVQTTHIAVGNKQEIGIELHGDVSVICTRHDLDENDARIHYGGPDYLLEAKLPNQGDTIIWLRDYRPDSDIRPYENPSDIAGLQAYISAVTGFARDIATQTIDFADRQLVASPTISDVLRAADRETSKLGATTAEPLYPDNAPAISEVLDFVRNYTPDWTIDRADRALLTHAYQAYVADVMEYNRGAAEETEYMSGDTSRELFLRYPIPGSDEHIDIRFSTRSDLPPFIHLTHKKPSDPSQLLSGTEEFSYYLSRDGVIERFGYRSDYKEDSNGATVKVPTIEPSIGPIGATEFLGLMRLVARSKVVRQRPGPVR
jgi:hypothetical protein